MIESELTSFLIRQEIARGRLLVAVSGGADSVALLRGLQGIAGDGELELVAGHFDHRLRAESAQDAEWVAALCDRWGIECHVGTSGRAGGVSPPMTPSGDLRLPLAERNETVEERARRMRYRFLHETALAAGCRWVAVAHTADDQAETVLHHIVRGSGIKGLQGMPSKRALLRDGLSAVELIRPLLSVSRRDVLAFLDAIGQEYRTDPTNDDPAFTRNRIRHSVLPFLREQLNPRIDEALLRLSAQAGEVQQTLDALAERLLAAAVLERQPDVVRLDCGVLAAQPVGLVREAFSRLWQQQNWPRQSMNFAHYDQLARLAMSAGTSQHALPGPLQAVKRRNALAIGRSTATSGQ